MKTSIFIFLLLLMSVVACKKKDKKTGSLPPVISGCTDPEAMNYNPEATQNNNSCEYADKYMPMRTGNYWLLQDTLNIPIPGFELSLPIDISLIMDKDTVMQGKTYYMMTQAFDIQNSPIPGGTIPTTRYGYRSDKSGKIYRLVPGDVEEFIFIDYPLEVGKSWEDQSSSPASYLVSGTELFYVPAIQKTVVAWKISITSDTLGGQAIDVYFAKDYGIVRQQVRFTIMGFDLSVDAFLQQVSLE